MAPGQILIEFVIPIVSVAATILGAFIVKKRRDKKKAACKTIDMAHDHCKRIELLENKLELWTEAYAGEAAAFKKDVDAQIDGCAKQDEFDRSRKNLDEAIIEIRNNMSSKGEMERYVDDGCTSVLGTLRRELHSEFQTTLDSLRNELENKMIDTAKKIGEDAESDVELDMVDVRKEINRKLQDYDLAITKWVGKKLEDYQPTLRGAFNATKHDVQADVYVDPDIDP